MLAKVVDLNQRDWSARLPQVMAAYRASQHEATGFSPNFLVYGRELRAPVDIVFGAPHEDENVYGDADEFVCHKLSVMEEAYALVRQNLGTSLQRAKRYYDLKARGTTYSVGTWVWYYCPRRYVQRSPKWQRMYQGPYLITRRINEVNYVLQQSRRSAPFVTHVDKLKACADQSRPNWLNLADDEAVDPTAAVAVERLPTRRQPSIVPARFDESSDEEERVVRPRRNAGRPSRFDDFV
jgi:hypothetical protein